MSAEAEEISLDAHEPMSGEAAARARPGENVDDVSGVFADSGVRILISGDLLC